MSEKFTNMLNYVNDVYPKRVNDKMSKARKASIKKKLWIEAKRKFK